MNVLDIIFFIAASLIVLACVPVVMIVSINLVSAYVDLVLRIFGKTNKKELGK